jgi:hypothetical protein
VTEFNLPVVNTKDVRQMSVDKIISLLVPKPTKATDQNSYRLLTEYLGRLDDIKSSTDVHQIHWPSVSKLSAHIGMDNSEAREKCLKLLNQWSKSKPISDLREEIIELLKDNGGVMTAIEIADAILLRRGSIQQSPVRERWAQAVVRAALETENCKQNSRCIIRRSGNRFLVANNQDAFGEELADYARDLGEIADECAQENPLLSPVRALEMIRAVPAPESFIGLSNHRLLRLASASSQNAALSSRAEFYPQGMSAEQALILAQGALLGTKALTVDDVRSRVAGRYPAAVPVPGRPQLDDLIKNLDMGFIWDPSYALSTGKVVGGYCLPIAGLTMMASQTKTQYHFTAIGETDTTGIHELELLEKEISAAIGSSRFLALSVRPKQMLQARDKLLNDYDIQLISFDELLLKHLHQLKDSMTKPLDWKLVLSADKDKSSKDWQNLQRLVQRVLPKMAEEIKTIGGAILLTEPGLLARYELVNTWLSDLRQHLMSAAKSHGLILLVAADGQNSAAVIDRAVIPAGAGSAEWARIPSVWLSNDINKQQA